MIPLIQQHSLSFLIPYFIKHSPCEIICVPPIQDPKDDEDRRGVYSKAQGQVGRIALICHGLYNAIQHAQQHPEEDTLMTLPNKKYQTKPWSLLSQLQQHPEEDTLMTLSNKKYQTKPWSLLSQLQQHPEEDTLMTLSNKKYQTKPWSLLSQFCSWG